LGICCRGSQNPDLEAKEKVAAPARQLAFHSEFAAVKVLQNKEGKRDFWPLN
jgi:hypothetical protein